MQTAIEDHFAVVQDTYQLEDWEIAARLLMAVAGLPTINARQQAKKSRGFLAANLSRDLAERLRDACDGQKISVQLVPLCEVIPAIKPMRVHEIRVADDAFWIQAPGGDAMTPLAWDSLRLIAVTKTTKTESFRHWETIPQGTGGYHGSADVKLKVTNYTESYAEYLADIYACKPHGEVHGVRILSRELNYAEALGDTAPDPLLVSDARTDGFRLLVASIAAHAAQVYLTPESQTLLQKTAREGVRVPPAPLDEFDAHNRWLLQRMRLKESQAGGAQLR